MVKGTYARLGTGALGRFYGAKLQKSGSEVHYLLKEDRTFIANYLINYWVWF
jgi:2-dehydropantoate 2-reductase